MGIILTRVMGDPCKITGAACKTMKIKGKPMKTSENQGKPRRGWGSCNFTVAAPPPWPGASKRVSIKKQRNEIQWAWLGGFGRPGKA